MSVEEIVDEIENGLNNLMPKEFENIRFKIHSNAGWMTMPTRQGNEITHYIDASVGSVEFGKSNTFKELGTLSFNIVFLIPAERPKTKAGEKFKDYNGKNYNFIGEIAEVINEYFKTARIVETIDDNKNKTFFSYTAGVGEVQEIERRDIVGVSNALAVHIGGSYIKNGVLSQQVHLSIDGEEVPQIVFSPTRGTTEESGVFTGLVVKSFSTSSVFSFEINIPSTYDRMSGAILDQLFEATLNEVHFITIQWGDRKPYYFLMVVNTPKGASQETAIATLSAKFIEIENNIDFITLPSDFGFVNKKYTDSKERKLTITTDKPCFVNVVNTNQYLKVGEELKLTIDEDCYGVGENDNYEVYVIYSDNTANITITES